MRYIDRYNWESFCQQYEKTENEMKSFLFKGELSKKEFETLIDCSRHTFIDFVYYIDYGKLFISCPRLIECCNWTRLDELSWSVLLSQKPEFADECNKWDEFDGDDWSNLLAKQPQFADKCDWDKLDGNAWGYLLSEQPQFADKCNWDSLKGLDWSCLLAKQPQFADKCAWDKFDDVPRGHAWSMLLEEQPQFADKCDVWDYLDADQWRSLLKNQPQFVDKCTKSSLVVNVLIKHPQFTEHCNTSVITEKGKAKLLAKHPDLVIYFPEKTEIKVPKKNTPKKQIKNKLVALLLENENAEVSSEELEKFTGSDWGQLLSEKPEFANKCDCHEVVGDIGINVMVNYWDKLTAKQWYDLLIKQPQFADKCNKWNDFPHWMLTSLLKKHPKLAKYFNDKSCK